MKEIEQKTEEEKGDIPGWGWTLTYTAFMYGLVFGTVFVVAWLFSLDLNWLHVRISAAILFLGLVPFHALYLWKTLRGEWSNSLEWLVDLVGFGVLIGSLVLCLS